jgi:hypothetical protein
VSIADGDEIGAVTGKRNSLDLAGDLVGGDLESGSCVPHVNNHVVHGADRHEQIRARVRREAYAFDGKLVTAEFAYLRLLANVPDANFRVMSTLNHNLKQNRIIKFPNFIFYFLFYSC